MGKKKGKKCGGKPKQNKKEKVADGGQRTTAAAGAIPYFSAYLAASRELCTAEQGYFAIRISN